MIGGGLDYSRIYLDLPMRGTGGRAMMRGDGKRQGDEISTKAA